MTKLRPPFKIHGGKYYLSSWVIDKFPKDYTQFDFIVPFVGAGSVLLNKTKSSVSEAVNDLDLGIVQIFRALRDEPKTFIGRIKRTKYCEDTFNRAMKKKPKDYMDHAIKDFILRRMSRGGLKKSFAWSNRKRGGQPGDVNAWETIVAQLPFVADRIKDVHIFNEKALNVIKAFDSEGSLIYADPPYLPDTRVSKNSYEYEMTTDDHIDLANVLNKFKGKVIISGYSSQLYRRLYEGWKCYKKKIVNHASQKKKKPMKTECLWINY